jgi:hypothetical protein
MSGNGRKKSAYCDGTWNEAGSASPGFRFESGPASSFMRLHAVELALQKEASVRHPRLELAHWDHRVADFALSWRGKYDEVIHGYSEVSPLEPEEWALITPLWWAGLIDGACHDLRNGTPDDGWTIKKLLSAVRVDGAGFNGVR